MFLPLIGPRLHGWLDDLVAATYLLGVVLFGLHGEGGGVLVAAIALTGEPTVARGFLALMGLSQFGAFAFSDYRTPA